MGNTGERIKAMRKIWILLSLVLVFSLFLTACGEKSDGLLEFGRAEDGYIEDDTRAKSSDTDVNNYYDGVAGTDVLPNGDIAGTEVITPPVQEDVKNNSDSGIYDFGGSAYDSNGNLLHDMPDDVSEMDEKTLGNGAY